MAVAWITSIFLLLIAATTPADLQELEVARLYFKSAQSTFTNDLLNPSSAAFRNRVDVTKKELEPIFLEAFPDSFKNMTVKVFSKGSVNTEADLTFVKALLPDHNQIRTALSKSVAKVTAFDIVLSSINVNGIYSSGISHNISFITASCLVLLSWLLSSQQ
ncbi:hypothetical protein FQN60_010482 [Etheostoma spectabile]|uniref:SEA domain-containing protein n=1 Tax=Etheostoma spectabile TaxID=54343 RepID=A0A5J5D506_9PERO|nr:hypothetical protein FQN60_010482 [Etheostoma spectabile]